MVPRHSVALRQQAARLPRGARPTAGLLEQARLGRATTPVVPVLLAMQASLEGTSAAWRAQAMQAQMVEQPFMLRLQSVGPARVVTAVRQASAVLLQPTAYRPAIDDPECLYIVA
jgi:hypothetical protein